MLTSEPCALQDVRDRLAELLQSEEGTSEEIEESLLATLGQALGLTLSVTALNLTAMLRLMAVRLDTLENLQPPLPESHWLHVLVCPC